jgi:CxxC-x17-CxxC domain-containing protein
MEFNTRNSREGGTRGSFRNGGFRGGSKGGFKGGWKGGDRGADRDSRPMTMHPATCSSCQKACEVPFRPTGEKPVYCRDCFAGRAALGGERSQRKDFRSESRPDTRTFAAPVAMPVSNKGNDELRKQIDSMNVKLDKLTNTIQNLAEKLNKAEAIAIVPAVTTPVVVEEKVVKAKKISKKK